MESASSYDAVVVGGGPAGLAAAHWLARYRRRVVVYDGGEPRNRAARTVHGYPGLADVSPQALLGRLREQALGAGAELIRARVSGVSGRKTDFRIEAKDGPATRARRVLLAYGVRDRLPDIPGTDALYGRSVVHCPDCDGPGMAGARVGVLGRGRAAGRLALYLTTWTEPPVLLTHGRPPGLDPASHRILREAGIRIRTEPVTRLIQRHGRLSAVLLEDGSRLPLEGLFFHLGTRPASALAGRLGCATDEAGHLKTDAGQQTTVPGVYAAGDLAGRPHLVPTATASGVRAALGIHRSLLPDAYRLRTRP